MQQVKSSEYQSGFLLVEVDTVCRPTRRCKILRRINEFFNEHNAIFNKHEVTCCGQKLGNVRLNYKNTKGQRGILQLYFRY